MVNNRNKRINYGDNISILRKNNELSLFKVKDATGRGLMTSYNVFPGIDIMFNDFQMQQCFSNFHSNVHMLTIDFCLEGRIEWEFQNGTFMYLGKDDIQICLNRNHHHLFGFPLHYYKGITIAIYLDTAPPSLFKDFSIDLQDLIKRFKDNGQPFIIRSVDSLQHIFHQLYAVPEKIRTPYFQLKIMELLLSLSTIDICPFSQSSPYFPKKQVETVKSIMEYMRTHIDERMTLVELSTHFNIPLTTMKNCFKAIYGQSIYSYLRAHRIEIAADLLRTTDETIATIAGRVGYSNPSKFSAAFKEIKGMPPTQYQKEFV